VNTQVRAQARALRALGHDVLVCGPASNGVGDGELPLGRTITVSVGGTESGFGAGLQGWRAARGLFARRTFDVVHVHEPLMPFVPWTALRRARAPLVGTFHVYREAGHPFYGPGRFLLGRLAARLSARIAVSEAARRTVAHHFPADYTVIPNGIDPGMFAGSPARPAAFAADRLHVLVAGRLEPRKGVEHLMAAMARVRSTVPDARLIIVGDGSGRAALERLARALSVDACFAGRVGDRELPAYFRAADVVCAPATGGESFGLVLIEAMAAGRPVVASRIDGYAELVAAAGVGTLVPPGDPPALAAALVALLGDPARRRREGDAGIAAAHAYEWPALARRVEEVYRCVLRAVSPEPCALGSRPTANG
jgi:phosphatidylinositol alpha-mannosyltransferase